jgi:hypothetical protein
MAKGAPFVLMGLSAFITFLLYRPGFLGGFMYDDAISLEGLGGVIDRDSALLYVISGDSGPLGRPLSLASFLLNGLAWPSSPGDFLYVNTLLHLANGLLVAWLVLIVARSMPGRLDRPEWFAALVASVWLLHPAWTFLVLHAVQRMAILSATFVLLGLIAYLKARAMMAAEPRRAMMLMVTSVGLGTVLAMLAKENGALLPLFAATLEWLLRSPGSGDKSPPALPPWLVRVWKYWPVALFWLPALVLATHLWQHWPGLNTAAGIREFTGGERLMTEARALWQYLFNLFLPRSLNFTPFHDDYVVSEGILAPISTLYAVLAWVFVAGLAWWWRVRFPLLFFAVAWFFVGHSIESTVVQLEMYFEHRNYLPSLGFVMLAVYGLWQLPEQWKRLRWLIAGAYLLMIGFILGQTASLWGNPGLAAVMWLERHPLSIRTIQFNANNLGVTGQGKLAADAIWQAHLRLPSDTGLAIQGAELSCWFSNPEEYAQRIDEILPQLRTGNYSHQPVASLPKMFNQLKPGGCPAQRASHLHKIIDALMHNPKYQSSARAMANFHYMLGQLYIRERDFNSTMEHLLASSRHEPNLDLTLEISAVFASGGLYDEAMQTLDAALKSAPENPVIRVSWQKRIVAHRSMLLERKKLQDSAASNPDSGER